LLPPITFPPKALPPAPLLPPVALPFTPPLASAPPFPAPPPPEFPFCAVLLDELHATPKLTSKIAEKGTGNLPERQCRMGRSLEGVSAVDTEVERPILHQLRQNYEQTNAPLGHGL